jgi:hypothetical protein
MKKVVFFSMLIALMAICTDVQGYTYTITNYTDKTLLVDVRPVALVEDSKPTFIKPGKTMQIDYSGISAGLCLSDGSVYVAPVDDQSVLGFTTTIDQAIDTIFAMNSIATPDQVAALTDALQTWQTIMLSKVPPTLEQEAAFKNALQTWQTIIRSQVPPASTALMNAWLVWETKKVQMFSSLKKITSLTPDNAQDYFKFIPVTSGMSVAEKVGTVIIDFSEFFSDFRDIPSAIRASWEETEQKCSNTTIGIFLSSDKSSYVWTYTSDDSWLSKFINSIDTSTKSFADYLVKHAGTGIFESMGLVERTQLNK